VTPGVFFNAGRLKANCSAPSVERPMKLLLFSDLHADAAAARALVQRAATADVLVGAGDFGNLRRHLSVCVDILLTANRPLVLVAGNNESTEELQAACRGRDDVWVLHGTQVELNGIIFYGLGGGVPVTPFGSWSYDFTEAQAAVLLAKCPSRCVLVTHSPPHGVVDVSSRGDHLGSTAVRDAIVRTQPRLVVCGHIHGSSGQTGTIGKTPVVNAGPEGVVWELVEP
jgi:Icc-related predicted phosphoesterase